MKWNNVLIVLIFATALTNNFYLIKIEKQLKELKELKLTIDQVESQLKLLTPPPEFFQLPVVKQP
jgi:hypothetical protein